MRRRSLTTRLLLSHLAAAIVALGLLGGSLLFLVARNQRLQSTAALQAQAAVYATYAAELAHTTTLLEGVADVVVRRFPVQPGTSVRIFAPNGSLLTSDRALGEFPSRSAQAFVAGPAPFLPLAPESRRYVAQPIRRGGQAIGIVEVSSSAEAERRLRRELLLMLLPASLLALCGALLLALLLARSLLRPLHALQHVAQTIAAGRLEARSSDHSPDEIGRLAAEINRMAHDLQARFEQIERLAETRREFYRSVSHELRTPLTAIRGMVENLEDDADPGQRRSLEVLKAETDRLQQLVEELLAGGEHTFAPLRHRLPVDLGALAAEVVALMRPRADRAGVRLVYHPGGGETIAGDRDRLKQALVNLLDNALKWTPAGGKVQVSVAPTGEASRREVVLTVADAGPGIPAELRDAAWERGRRGADGGQGLGLALVREVLQAHGGTARIVDGPGTTVELRLPRLRR